MTTQEFVESEYLTHAAATLAESTCAGYRKLWNAHARHFAGWALDMRTCDAQGILRTIAGANPTLNKTSLRHIKAFFSGISSHALRMGRTHNNPWRDVKIPMAPDPGDTYAYSPEEIESILGALTGMPRLVALLAACTGLRKSEIRGLRWSDWHEEASKMTVNRAVWQSHVKTTKSLASKAPVPVVPVLADALVAHRSEVVAHRSEVVAHKSTLVAHSLIFASSTNTPLDLGNLAARVIIPVVGKTWHGWHAFRRGLATFLHAQGVDDKTIQAILRHENISVTQKCYVKTLPESVRAAMANVKFGGGKTTPTEVTYTSPTGDSTVE